MVLRSIQLYYFFPRDTVELERTHFPHGQLFQLSINPRIWSMGRTITFEKHDTSLFLLTSESATCVIETADDWLGRTSSRTKIVLWKQCNRTDHDCMYYFNLRRAQSANLVFHESCSDAIVLSDNMPASALDKVATFAGEVLFGRKPQTLNKAEATLADRIDMRKKKANLQNLIYSTRDKQNHLLLISSLISKS